jgi:hypothetical protein
MQTSALLKPRTEGHHLPNGQHNDSGPSTPEEVLRLCRSIVGHNDDAGILLLIEVEGIDGTMTGIRMARRPCVNSARHYLVACIDTARTKQANGHHTNGATLEEPPSPTSEDDYGATPHDDGIKPRTKTQHMAHRLALKDMWRLYKLRRVNERWEMWLAGISLNEFLLYTAVVLGQRTRFIVDEDIAIRLMAGKFPRIHPWTETKAQTSKRRDMFNRRRKKETKMQMEQTTGAKATMRRPPITRLQALIKALPHPPDVISIADLAKKLRPHESWRTVGGKMLKLASIEHTIRMARQYSPDIGSRLEAGSPITWVLWRRQ